MVGVPYLGVAAVGADCKMLAAVAPADAGDLIVLELAQLFDLGCTSTPYINCSIQPDGKHILSTPINQIKIEIILQLRSVKYLEWNFVDLSIFSSNATLLRVA